MLIWLICTLLPRPEPLNLPFAHYLFFGMMARAGSIHNCELRPIPSAPDRGAVQKGCSGTGRECTGGHRFCNR